MPEMLPTRIDAWAIAEASCGEPVRRCERFMTGLRHWVYDVELQSQRRVVVRMSDPRHRAELAGGVYWSAQLAMLDVPVASVLAHDTDCAQPYMVLERLPGTDLGNCFDELDEPALARLAESVAEMQQRAATLPEAQGYGYALHHNQPLNQRWQDVIAASVQRSEAAIRAVGVVDPSLATRVRRHLGRVADTLDSVRPQAFLHDATTKNVIVHDGQLSGLVDVDTMAFGDPLWAVALTRMSLLSASRPTHYTDTLAAAMGYAAHSEVLDIYTSVFCLGFLSELGQTFNRDEPAAINDEFHEHLVAVLQALLD